MLVSDILRGKGSLVVTIDPDSTVEALVELLGQQRIGAAVVSTDGTTVAGIVSERDVVRALAEHGPAALDQRVGSVCTTQVMVVVPGDRLEQVMQMMTEGRFRHLPVVVDGRLQGIVSIGDVVKSRMSELEGEREALASYITDG